MRGQDRIHIGKQHETDVRKRLDAEGWEAQEWGNGLLADTIRNVLQHQPTKIMLRWLPDLLAVRDFNVRLIDAKSGWSDTPFHSLEIDAYACHLILERVFGIPVVYVWEDFTVNTAGGIKYERWEARPNRTNGSGTPFMLVRKSDQRPWDWAFPAPATRTGSLTRKAPEDAA